MSTDLPPFADERVVAINRLPMHAPLRAYSSAGEALAKGCVDDSHTASEWVIPLTPAKWDVHLAPNPTSAPTPRPAIGYDLSVSGWRKLAVPSNWQLDPELDDNPIYCNYRYPMAGTETASLLKHFPVPREENPVGSYQTTFTLPSSWNGRTIFLQLDGVDSNATIWINGVEIGYSQDSRLPCEFDITHAVAPLLPPGHPDAPSPAADTARADLAGEHTISVRVLRWCDGSYLEDQDMWRLSGLHRHVRVYSKPSALRICDYAFVTTNAALDADAALDPAAAASPAAAAAAAASPAADAPHRGTAAMKLAVRCDGAGTDLLVDSMRVVASLRGPFRLAPGETPPPAGAANAPAEVWRASARVVRAEPLRCSDEGLREHGEEIGEVGGLLTGAYAAQFGATLGGVSLWSAETPYLYTLLVELRDGQGALVDCEASLVGLRAVTISEGLVRVNGRPVTFRGVNRHDHCPQNGKAVPWATMVRDVSLMKAHSFNAVRCSTIPTTRAFWSSATRPGCTWSTRRTLRRTAASSSATRARLPRLDRGGGPLSSGLRGWCSATRTTRASSRGRSATRAATGGTTTRWRRGRARTSLPARSNTRAAAARRARTSSARCTRRSQGRVLQHAPGAALLLHLLGRDRAHSLLPVE